LVQTEETQESSIKFFVQTEESEYPREDHGKEKKNKKKGKKFLTKTSNCSGKSARACLSSTDVLGQEKTFLGFAVGIKLEKSQEKFE
jgi:hypothetical protein